jgi:hypothetical protein
MIGFGFRWLFQGASSGAGAARAPRTVPVTLWINDTPIERFGFVLQRPAGWLDTVTRPLLDTSRIPGLTGGRYEQLPTVPSRDVTISGVLLDVNMDALQAQLAALNDQLSGLLELRWPHAPGFVQRGMAGPLSVEPYNPDKAFVRPDAQAWRVSVTIRCSDGATYARAPRRIRLGTTPKPVLLGGLPVGGEVLLEGPLSGSVNLDLYSPAGGLLERLALRGVALSSGDVGTIRFDAPNTITKRTALGVETNVYAWRSLTESTRWWKVSPIHADPARGQYALASLSTGSGWWTYVVGEAA